MFFFQMKIKSLFFLFLFFITFFYKLKIGMKKKIKNFYIFINEKFNLFFFYYENQNIKKEFEKLIQEKI